MDSPELRARLRLYSKQLAEHTFNQWILSLQQAQSRTRPERPSPPQIQHPPWFPPMVQLGAQSSQISL
ncbi:hypothetical protein RhiJN_14211 [Ceratobasidium sp. AG-Ba]|nr:hypothetical protein RhiJN_14211 [Ceratobasidium sp. AG-Ba]QRW14762.1 hypothetical protein RhiLY_13761 [Ceratobasidium sp. AG-Ba]